MMTAKELVMAFYNSDLANDVSVVSNFFHKDCELHWSSSHGFKLLDYKAISEFFDGTRKSYSNIRFEFTHVIDIDSVVTTRHTLFGNTIENPDSEIALAHFVAIWEVKDNKLYRSYEISQQANISDNTSMNSFAERKI